MFKNFYQHKKRTNTGNVFIFKFDTKLIYFNLIVKNMNKTKLIMLNGYFFSFGL